MLSSKPEEHAECGTVYGEIYRVIYYTNTHQLPHARTHTHELLLTITIPTTTRVHKYTPKSKTEKETQIHNTIHFFLSR